MRVFREEILWARVDIGEVATPTAGYADFLAWVFGVIEHQRARTRMDRAHHTSGACA